MSKAEVISFSANGKLLLTGEYLIIDGATGLALPLNARQTLTAQASSITAHASGFTHLTSGPAEHTSGENTHDWPAHDLIDWSAYDVNGRWFQAKFSIPGFELLTSDDPVKAKHLQRIIRAAASLNPKHPITKGFAVTTRLNYNRLYGFGSSSTLIALIAHFFETDKYVLHNMVSNGSGYDVACTEVDYPILYTRHSRNEAIVKPVNFNPVFTGNLWLIYLGSKQDTDAEVSVYRASGKKELTSLIGRITDITLHLTKANDLTTFASLIEQHEEIMSSVLQRPAIKESKFKDFKGFIKSLGAWGGDFILAGSDLDQSYVLEYFKLKGYQAIYRYRDLVLNNQFSSDHDTVIRF